MSTIIDFVYLGLQFKWNQLTTNNSRHTSCIHKGLHAGKWPDLLIFKPDSARTLVYHWTDYTGTALADAITQWCPSGNPVLICMIGTHWKTTGATSTLGIPMNHTGWCYHPVVFLWQSSVNLHNWNTLRHTGNTLAANNSFSSGIPVYTVF